MKSSNEDYCCRNELCSAQQGAGHTQENKEPVIFLKPDSAILKDGKPFFIPDFSNEVHYETEVVVRICRLGKNIAPRFAHRYYDAVTVGIDFTARDLQRKFREAGNPWELCKGFDNSAAIGTFVPLEQAGGDVQRLDFHLTIDGKEVQRGVQRTCCSGWMTSLLMSAAS